MLQNWSFLNSIDRDNFQHNTEQNIKELVSKTKTIIFTPFTTDISGTEETLQCITVLYGPLAYIFINMRYSILSPAVIGPNNQITVPITPLDSSAIATPIPNQALDCIFEDAGSRVSNPGIAEIVGGSSPYVTIDTTLITFVGNPESIQISGWYVRN